MAVHMFQPGKPSTTHSFCGVRATRMPNGTKAVGVGPLAPNGL